jgi:hypothetical protein
MLRTDRLLQRNGDSMENPPADDLAAKIEQFFGVNCGDVERFVGAIGGWVERCRPVIEQFGEALISFHVAFSERMKLYPKLLDEVLPLAKRGWFIPGAIGLSDLAALAELCGNVSAEELDMHIAGLYRADIETQMNALLMEHPNRAFALRPALNAHLRGEYALSIPIFFAHVDGICNEREKRCVFCGNKNKSDRMRELAEKKVMDAKSVIPSNLYDHIIPLFEEMMWLPLSELLPLSYAESDREKNTYLGLNRHTVLHGLALAEYATEENSLKAFSMLSHVASLMAQQKDAATGNEG